MDFSQTSNWYDGYVFREWKHIYIGEFENAMSTGGWVEVMCVLKTSEKLLTDTLRGDEESVGGLQRRDSACGYQL